MRNKLDFVVYIGRMQPPTLAHIANIKKALEISNTVIVLFGSSFQPRTIKNPWTDIERSYMILHQLPPEEHSRIKFYPLHDHRYNDQEWVTEVQKVVKTATKNILNPTIGIIGCKKDSTSYYLDYFPQWKMIEMDIINDINATAVRDEYFSGNLFSWKDKELISPELREYLSRWSKTVSYEDLVEEYNFIQKYKKGWENSPYPPTFITVDSCIIQSGHVLLIQRKQNPGKNLFAFPGGFVNQTETLLNAAIRELKEETRLKVPVPVIKGSLKSEKIFDDPNRSLRGRTISVAFLFQLPPGELSKVKGGDDAKHARWIPINDALEMEEIFFEDHFNLLQWAVNNCQ